MRRLLLRCYPAAWRQRYGDEFEAILTDRPLGPFDVLDVLLGAIDAHLHLRGAAFGSAATDRKGFLMTLRIGGLAAIAGAVLWAAAFIVSFLRTSPDDPNPLAGGLFLLSTCGFLLALTGLSAFQARSHPRLVWAGFALPAIGAGLAIVGLLLEGVAADREIVAGFTPWAIWFVGMLGLLIGSAAFATTTFLTAALSRSAAIALGVGSIGTLIGVAVGSTNEDLKAVAVVVFVLFPLGWIALGLDAIRRDGQPAVQAAG